MPVASDKLVRVAIIEDDPYTRNIITLLLIRDWRTQVVGEGDKDIVANHVGHANPNTQADILLVDAEHPVHNGWLEEVITSARAADKKIKLVLLSTHWQPAILHLALRYKCQGYLLKPEIGFSLGWAVAAAGESLWVCTHTVQPHAQTSHPPKPRLTIDGRDIFAQLKGRHLQVARLAVIFNLRHTDIADELGITPHQINRLVSEVYDRIGLNDLLTGKDDPRRYFQHTKVIERFLRAQHWEPGQQAAHQAREKATLAFHLLTVPVMQSW